MDLAPTSPSERIPIRVMNMCISFSIRVAERCTSKRGKNIAASAQTNGKAIIIKIPAKPWNNAPSPRPPVRNMIVIAVINPATAAPPTKRIRKRRIGISKRRIATSQTGILSIIFKPPTHD